MSYVPTKHNLLALCVCILLTIQSIMAIPPQEMGTEPCPTFAIPCFVSLCLGCLIYALIYKYCTPEIVTTPTKPSESNPEKLPFEMMQKNIADIRAEHQQTVISLQLQDRTISDLTAKNMQMQLLLCGILSQVTHLTEQNRKLFTFIHALHKAENGRVPSPVAHYWMDQAKKQKDLLDQYQKQTTYNAPRLLITEK